MSNQEAFYSQLYQYIEKIANQVSDLRGSDTIKTGTIIQVLPGHYVVQLNEGNEQSSVKAIALNTNDLFSLQDYVYLMQATGSIENTYFIIGKVEQIQEDFLNLTLTERFTSSNELSGDLLKLNTKIEDLTILSDIKANRVFQIKGTFTCNKSNEENEENYGLKVSFNCGDQVIKTYNLDTNYFIGQPFKMTSQLQMRTILLDEVVLKSNFDNIIITKFGSNFTCSDITIASGSLLDVNGIVNVSLSFKNKKDYFSLSGTEVDNSIKVNAEVEYEGAPLVAPGIQYYWLLKDDSIDENSKYYFSYAGKGWKCLNTYDNVSGVGADGFSLTLQIWESGENNIILSETGFPDFINTFKCIVKYQDIVVSSPETTIYNYNKESFFVELESNIQPPLLILETDQVILSAVVEDENEKTHMSDYTCAYQWQVENENGDWEVVTKKEESEGVFEDTFAFNEYNAEHVLTKDWSKLTIVDQLLSDIMEGDSSFYVLHGEGEEITKNFRCVVRVYRKDDLLNYVSKDDLSNYVSEDFSESMQVVSKVAIAAQLVSTTYYKYYISDTQYTLFPKLANKEGDWEGDWSISIKRISEEEEEYFVSQNWTEDSNLAHWSSDGLQEFPRGKVNQDAYNYIIGNFIENHQKGSYLYITSQEVWVEKRLKKINFLRKDNWTPPVLAKGYSKNGNYLDDKAVDKLNTFTHLTEGGLKKGLLYDEETGDVYINADFIKTGALQVADDLGHSVFYADVASGSAEIAGFTVNTNNLTHNDLNNLNEYVYLGYDKLQMGQDVVLNHSGLHLQKVSISEDGLNVNDIIKATPTEFSIGEALQAAINSETGEISLTLTGEISTSESSIGEAFEEQTKQLEDLEKSTSQQISELTNSTNDKIDKVNEIANEQAEQIKQIGNRRLWIVYSSLNEKPTSLPEYGVEYPTTASTPATQTDPQWHTVVTNSDRWQSQRVANSLSEVADGKGNEWSAIIQTSGRDGVGVQTVVEYYVTNNISELPIDWNSENNKDFNFSPTIISPTEDKPYLWNYEITRGTDGLELSRTEPVIIAYFTKDGESGWTIDTIINYYATSTTATAPGYGDGGTSLNPKANWTRTPTPIDAINKYLWNYEVITYKKVDDSEGTKSPTITDPAIIGSYGDKGETGSAMTYIYKVSSTVISSAPSSSSGSIPTGWSTTFPTSLGNEERVYMSQRMDNVGIWSVPVPMSALNGKKPIITVGENGNWFVDGIDTNTQAQGDTPTVSIGTDGNWIINNTPTSVSALGKDGSDTEYVYYLSDSAIAPSRPSTTLVFAQPSSVSPNEWTSSPQGVSFEYQYEYVSVRTKPAATAAVPQPSWGSFSAPVLWSKYGQQGLDGDGVEYEFYASASKNLTDAEKNSSSNWKDDETLVADFSPNKPYLHVKVQTRKHTTSNTEGGATTTTINYGIWKEWPKSTYYRYITSASQPTGLESGWSETVPDESDQNIWAQTKVAYSSTTGNWGTAYLFSPSSSYSIHIQNDYITIPVNSDGTVDTASWALDNPDFRTATYQVYKGAEQLVYGSDYKVTGDTINDKDYFIVINPSTNVSFSTSNKNNIIISNSQTTSQTYTVSLYKRDNNQNILLANADIDVVRQVSGVAGEYAYIQASSAVYKSGSSNRIELKAMKKVGSSAPASFGGYWKFTNCLVYGSATGGSPWGSIIANAETLYIVPNGTSAIAKLYSDSSYTVLVDQENFLSVADGQSISSLKEFYGVSNDRNTVPSSWTEKTASSSLPETNINNKYLWNYEEYYTTGNVKIGETTPIIVHTYGAVLSNTEVFYATNTTGDTPSLSDWGKNQPSSVSPGTYVWIKTLYTFDDGSYYDEISVSRVADDGNSITVRESSSSYSRSKSESSRPTTWYDTVAGIQTEGDYLWTKSTIIFSDSREVITYSVSYQGHDGASLGEIHDIYCYTATNSAPSVPTAVAINSSTGAITSITSVNNWSTSDNGFLYNSPSSTDNRIFKWGCEVVVTKADNTYAFNNCTVVQSLGEMPKQEFTQYCGGFSAPASDSSSWSDTLPSSYIHTLWARTKVDYNKNGSESWSQPYIYAQEETVITAIYDSTECLNPSSKTFGQSINFTIPTGLSSGNNGKYVGVRIQETLNGIEYVTIYLLRQKGITNNGTTGQFYYVGIHERESVLINTDYYYRISTSKTTPPDNYKTDPTNWKDEATVFSSWYGRELNFSTNNIGSLTYVWQTAVLNYSDGSKKTWSTPVLMTELRSVELAAQYQIKDSVYVTGFLDPAHNLYPITTKGGEYSPTSSITGNLQAAMGVSQQEADKKFPGASSTSGIGEGDIGRWCRLYDRTITSGGMIKTGTITADEIAANAITAEKIEVDKLSTIIANMGELTVGVIKSENYSSTPVYENTTYIHSSTEYLWGDEAITNYSFQRTVLPNGNLASTYDLTIYVKVPLPIVNSFCDFSTGNFSSINITYKNQAGKAGIAFNDGTGINTYPSANRPYITLWMRNDGLSSNLDAHLPASITIGNFTYSVSKIKTFSDITGALISFENTDSPYIVFPNFQIAPNGDIYSIGGTIGGFTIGNNALYNGYSIIDPPSFNTIESNTVYLGTDGIRLGEKFSVSPLGRLIAEEGNIAGFEISQTALINTDGTSYITISQGDTNNNYSVSLKGDELVFSHTELDGVITSMHYSRYKENSLLITGEKDANSRRANTILDTMISYSPSLSPGSRITEAATLFTGLKDTYDYRIGSFIAPPIIIGKQQEYTSEVYHSLIKMGSFLSFPDYKTGILNYNHSYAYTKNDDDKSTWLLYDYKDNKTYDLPELIKFTAENKEYAESHKFYIWEYPKEITDGMVVASNHKDYPANHGFSEIFGAIATGRRTGDDMSYFNWNAILSTRIDGTIVRVASDSGKCSGGFYCIIFGK